MPTIKSVAKLAGVSISTVSRVLNSSGYVSSKNRKLVMDAVAKLDFRPNHVARSLVYQETKTLGLIIPDITNPYFPALARSVENAAKSAGYAVILCNSGNTDESETRYFSWLKQRMVDGILLASTNKVAPEIVEKDWPVVLIDRDLTELKVDSVKVDNISGAEKAIHYLLDLGHQNIAHLAGPQEVNTARERVAGFSNTLAAAGIDPIDHIVIYGPFSYESGYERMLQLLQKKNCPTAVFCANDMIALGALRACRERGLQIPKDISICGFDDIFLAEHIDPPLTTVRQPVDQMGQTAVELLLSRVRKRNQNKVEEDKSAFQGRIICLQPELVIRATCAQPVH